MAKIKFISLDQLLEMKVNKENIKIVDVLPEDSFKQGHIPGAINIPLENLSSLAENDLKKTDRIIVYCANYNCQASTKASEMLSEKGYKKILDFKAGKNGWVHAGLELEK